MKRIIILFFNSFMKANMKNQATLFSTFFALILSCFSCNHQEAIQETDPAFSGIQDTVIAIQTDTPKLHQDSAKRKDTTRFKVKRK